MQPLRTAILRADPLTTGRWLDRAGGLLSGLHDGHIPLDHAALDTLPQRKAVDYLRALLISSGVLPPDPGGGLRRLEREIPDLLAELTDTHRQIEVRWIRWAVLPRLRKLSDHGTDLTVAVRNDRRKIAEVAEFLTVLQCDGKTLDGADQSHIDTWFAGPGARRWLVRPFLVWAHRNRCVPAQLTWPKSYKGTPTTPLDSEARWRIAQRLITDDSLDPADRIAGALVVFYAQPLARISTLTTADVDAAGDVVHLRLGPDPLELPEPFATIIQRLPVQRRDSTAQQLPSPWLFASSNHAGRHLTIGTLGNRLRAIGIEPRRVRLAAADQLTREVPPAMLAGVLGLNPASVARATTLSSGEWAPYANRQSG